MERSWFMPQNPIVPTVARFYFQEMSENSCDDIFPPAREYFPYHMSPDEYYGSFGSLETGMELNPSLDETLHEQGLETSLNRLNLSTPFHQSQFLAQSGALEDTWCGVGSMVGNNFDDSIMASGLAPSTYAQELQYLEMMRMQEQHLQMVRIQSAVRGQMGYYTRPLLSNNHGLAPPRSSRNGIRLDSNLLSRGRSRNGLRSDAWMSLQPSQQRPTYPSLEELNGHLLSVAKDRRGYPLMQKNNLHELMVHPRYYHQIQKRFEESNEEQLTEILLALISNEQNLTRTCTDDRGSRSMQKLLEHLQTPEQISLAISALRNFTLNLTKSPSGQFVIKKCLKLFSAKDNKHILNEIAENCPDIATDRVGCCVMQDCVNYSNGETRERLVAEIIANALLLSEHPYGNFVVQGILELRMPHVAADILAQLEGSFLTLSMNKHGSHVVQKCLEEFGEEHSTRIIKELISSPEHALNFLQDQWGNYVAQTAKVVAKGTIRQDLMRLINIYKPFLENHPHGKCVLAPTKGKKHRAQSCMLY